MAQEISPSVKAIFTQAAPAKIPVTFVWRSISRKGRPFLLVRDSELDSQMGLGLYSAQRKRAKFSRALLPFVFRSPAKIWFHQVRLEADGATDLMQFMAQQSGVEVSRLKTPAIKFGGAAQRSRLALLLGDETDRPVKVIKVGLNQAGRAATEREANFLETLPPNKLGCVRQCGRLSTPDISAFATDYFPGVSPADDAGLEHLFHSWLNPGPPQAIETLDNWQEMADTLPSANPAGWHYLQTALAGKKIRTTLFHGDFAPWNISAVNAQNLRVYDWERGHLQGIPAWDWFHFIIQTSILARRLSVERVAAELEQLIHSGRFRTYARNAGISDVVKPLVLASLLHQKWVIKPLEGGAATAKLYEFLVAHWRIKLPAEPAPPVAKASSPGLLATARLQLRSAKAQWINLFWEPSLNYRDEAAMPAQILAHWPVVLAAALMLAVISTSQYFASAHLMFLPLHLAVCTLLTWKTDRRLGGLAATIAAPLGPLMTVFKDGSYHWEWFVWNTIMRFIILEMGVLFTNRIREQKNILQPETEFVTRPPTIADNWAVLLASGVSLVAVTWLDYITDPHIIFLPLYLFPCTVITLVSSLRWGIAASLVTTAISSYIEYDTNGNTTIMETFGWNFCMRLLVFVSVNVLVDIIRNQHILFSFRKHNH